MWLLLHIVVSLALIVRVILKPHREPASRLAWTLVILILPAIGIIGYLLLGETNIGRRRIERMNRILAGLPRVADAPAAHAAALRPAIPERWQPLFRVGHSINGFEPVGGNRARLMDDSNAAIEAMVADIDAATEHVHLLFYIWLPDTNGLKMAEAVKRAAGRGVVCRVMVDDLGSRIFWRSEHWQAMGAAGVKLGRALPIGNPLLRIFNGRIDLRNHRKIVVIDDAITYCGSQNCADPEFRIKARFAPWVDLVVRFEGPVARQNQHLFVADWMAYVDERIDDLLRAPLRGFEQGITAQVVGSGPTVRYSAMPEMFETLMYSARRELVVTTPYFVPDESMQAALCASARRGVATSIVFPARNDSRLVAAASRSNYAELLAAGVRIFEYGEGLLHAKTLTLDGEVTLIGSANMDRRSFDLNYENNILVYDPVLSRAVRQRQESYIASSKPVTLAEVEAWTLPQRLLNNTLAMLGPVL
ncbi:MAG: cardiolipin synthase [Geminicoccaceae bacterium]|nr:cardiolipin synthase [Geminicoccaceae bacterium]HRY26988.1 cardiolipin synthase [Geminicoccaceae bacterium]